MKYSTTYYKGINDKRVLVLQKCDVTFIYLSLVSLVIINLRKEYILHKDIENILNVCNLL